MSEIGVSDYGIFSSAVSTANSAVTSINTSQTEIENCKSILNNDAVFMGPICDSCMEGFQNVGTKIKESIENFEKVKTFLTETADSYKRGDTAASNAVLNIAGSVSGGSTQASSLYELGNRANNGDKAAQQEWLNKMSSIVKPYCQKYGFPTSVLLAQIIQESGWTKSTSWLNDNNNVLNVNSEMFGSGDYIRSKDGIVNNNASIPRWASNPKHASGSVSGGAYFEAPRDDESMRVYDSIEDCAEDYLALMVGYRPYLNGADVDTAIDGVKGYAEDANYANNLHYAVDHYNLTQYDV